MAITLDGTNGITSPDFEPSSSTTPTNGLFLPAANTVGLATGSTERLRLDASGNLGLGVTPSTWGSGFKALQVGLAGALVSDAVSTTRIYNNVYFDGTNLRYINSSQATQYRQTGSQHDWWIAPSGTAGAAISFTQAMTLDASGNLGIGTSSPSTYGQLSLYRASGDVEAAVVTGGANYATYRIQNSTNRYSMQIRTDVSNAWVLRDETNSANRLVVDTSGNLLVGTTTGSNNAKVTVFSDTTTGGGFAIASSASLYRHMYLSNTGTVLQFWNGTNQANLSAAGAWTNASDARLKKDIVDIKYGLSTVLAAEPRSFKRIDVDGDFIGFIAQEIKNLVPEVVFGSDAEGDQYTVDYGSLVAVAFKAIQELTARLEALENK